MKRLGIIPARGGSKRLPRKNLLLLDEKPLVQHTIEAVINSNRFDTIILTSDDQNILDVGSRFSQLSCELRESELSADNTKVIKVVHNICARNAYASKYQQVGLFLPTFPFRTAEDIRKGIDMLTTDTYSVISISPMSDPLQLCVAIDPETNIIDPTIIYEPSPLQTGNTRSQDFTEYYRVNGGFYIAWMQQFLKRDNFFQGKVKGFPIDGKRSVDIDEQYQLDYANFLVQMGHINL
ncbi:MAG: hypothetical protein CL398_01975 [Acidiferrobacteraceae bacterium]|nr:hypothetical protein [Acidiferrobacteraceae bacterium]